MTTTTTGRLKGTTTMHLPDSMPDPSVPDLAQMALADLHPDPKVQASLWRLYHEAPGLLDARAYITVAVATGVTHGDLMDRLHDRRGPA